MTLPDTRARAVRRIASQPRRTLIAIAAGTLMLAGCGSSDNDNGNNGSNGSQPPQVNQLNTLKGATRDVTVEFHERAPTWLPRRRPTERASRSPRRARCG